MNSVLVILAVQGLLGAVDTVWFHEWRCRLPARPEMRPELALHAVRSVIYGIVFCSLPWVAWRGPWGLVLVGLLVGEAVITFTDFVVEDRVRSTIGGVSPGERVMHGVMAVVYGAFLTRFIPVVAGWVAGHGVILSEGGAPLLRVGLTALGVGALLSGLRDAAAAFGVEGAAWPWLLPAGGDRKAPVGAPPTPPWITIGWVPHRRRHRVVFGLAAAYNIGWGLFSVARPQWLFDLAGMPPANHPQIFAALAMVVGLYGVLYLAVAAYPEHGWLCAAVGLTGKLLGPVGLAALVASGEWPPATAVICLTNDLVWWIPFAQYLRDARPLRATSVACAPAESKPSIADEPEAKVRLIPAVFGH